MTQWMIRIFVLVLMAQVSFAVPQGSGGGSGVRGGGDPDKAKVATIKWLIENGDLKKALLSYVNKIDVESLGGSTADEVIVKNALSKVLTNQGLQKDIATTDNYVAGSFCQDAYSNKVFASTTIGEVGGRVCFDVDRLALNFAPLTAEQMLISLAVLTLHEHVHHFQNSSAAGDWNEKEAYLVGAYMQATAHFPEMPPITWAPPARVCPWKIACELKRTGDSLGNLWCMRTYSDLSLRGVPGEQIVKQICGQDASCYETSMKNAPTVVESIRGANFVATGLICGHEVWSDGPTSIEMFAPGKLEFQGRSYPLAGELTYSPNKTLQSFTPSTAVKTVLAPLGPQGLDKSVFCSYNSYFDRWDTMSFAENGGLLDCLIPSQKLMTKYGARKFYNAEFYETGLIKKGDIEIPDFLPIQSGKRLFKLQRHLQFYPDGSIQGGGFMTAGRYYGVCFDSKGNIRQEGYSLYCE
jgi:hypothetical protein